MNPSPSRRKLVATVAIAVTASTLVIRWGLIAHHPWGPRLAPPPDALEYAAAAQALAQEGRHVLHVGPYTVPPRFPPGWPLILAAAIRLGVSTDWLWYVAGAFAALHAALLAVAACLATQAYLRGRVRCGSYVAPGIAGLIAGVGWAVTPVSVTWARLVMSDEAAAFLANAALLCFFIGLFATVPARASRLFCGAAGLLGAAAIMVRTVSLALLIAPTTVLVVMALRRHGGRETLRRLAVALVGVCVPAIACSVLMWRSGRPPYAWSAYSFWIPETYGQISRTFHPRFAVQGNPAFLEHTNGALGHGAIAGRLLLGLPVPGQAGLGRWWPVVAWASGLLLLAPVAARRSKAALAVAGGLTAWIAAHVLIYSLYFFPGTRFYLAAVAWAWVVLAVALSVAWERSGCMAFVFLAAGGVLFGLNVWGSLRPYVRRDRLPQIDATRRAPFLHWWSLPATERARLGFPMDPIQAQALGLLTPEVIQQLASSSQGWGSLPSTEHVERLKMRGVRIETQPATPPE